MRVCLRLFGTLPEYYPGDYPPTGLKVDIRQDISVAELVKLVQLPQDQVAIVFVNRMLAITSD
jgi:hypothetical protein